MTKYVGGDPYQSLTFGKSLSLRVDGGFNSVSINPSGRDVVLAGRQGLYIIDLDDPFSPPRWLQHITPWQVADVQWSPHPAKPYWVVSTSNQKALIWNLMKNSSDAIEHVLHGHTRAITDINFNGKHPDILATCSIDTYVHAWDMRSPQRPFYTTSDWKSAAAQVKWHSNNSNILASAHSKSVLVWDLRYGSTPLTRLDGHKGSINSIDFNRSKETEIMTCSNDGTVKFWDYKKSTLEKSITTDFPVWRGRYLPFGKGCCIVPMVGGENCSYILGLDDEPKEEQGELPVAVQFSPVNVFKGHKDRISDFIWRSRYSSPDEQDYQLVTWSKDCDLRLWPLSDAVYKNVNYMKEEAAVEQDDIVYDYSSYHSEPAAEYGTGKGQYKCLKEAFVTKSGLRLLDNANHMAWLAGVRMNDNKGTEDIFSEQRLQNLGEEVSAVGHKFPKIVFEKISVSTGELVVTLDGPWASTSTNPEEYIFLRVAVKIPAEYPNNGHPPIFTIEENGKLSSQKKNEIVTGLSKLSTTYTNLNYYCLEPCLKFLLGEQVSLDEVEDDDEPLFNFDISRNISFDDISSRDNDELTTASSTDSEDNAYNEISPHNDRKSLLTNFGRDMTFDSTPVPNECGMVWTASGSLICFFSCNNTPEYNAITGKRLSVFLFGDLDNKTNDDKTSEMNLLDSGEANMEEDSAKAYHKPKTYVEKIMLAKTSSKGSDKRDSEAEDSDTSSDTYSEDWDDVLQNDIIFQVGLPGLHWDFRNGLGVGPASSVKTSTSVRKNKNVIKLVDFSHLIPDQQRLAIEYQFTSGVPELMARHNAIIAEKHGYEQISHCWQILSDFLIEQEETNLYNLSWDRHSIGIKWFLKDTIAYFEKQNNIQMLAMISCVFVHPSIFMRAKSLLAQPLGVVSKPLKAVLTFPFDKDQLYDNDAESSMRDNASSRRSSDAFSKSRPSLTPDGSSTYTEDYFSYADHDSRTSNWIGGDQASSISGSISPMSCNNPPVGTTIEVELLADELISPTTSSASSIDYILDRKDALKLAIYRYQYAELLLRWGMILERAMVLKIPQSLGRQEDERERYVDTAVDQFTGLKTKWVTDQTARNCNFCGLRATRSISVCGKCQHVIHASCAVEWWSMSSECPSGCGCSCIL